MRKLDQKFIKQRVDYILTQARQSKPPVDLIPLARIQRVRIIDLRPMMLEGSIDAIPGGFKIYVRDNSFQSVDIDDDSDLGRLNARQRFTLAHEIVHTFFYDSSNDPPVTSKMAPKLPILESLCQHGAGQILVPETLLVQEFTENKYLTPHLTINLARKFKTSAEVVIRRVNEIDRIKRPDRALILASMDKSGSDAQIRAVCYHPSLSPYILKPKLYSNLKELYGKFLEEDFWYLAAWDQRVERGSATLLLKKRPYSSRGQFFFLEIELTFSH